MCRATRACGRFRCRAEWIDHALGSGASARFIVSGSSASHSRRSLALTRLQCIQPRVHQELSPVRTDGSRVMVRHALVPFVSAGQPDRRGKVDAHLGFVEGSVVLSHLLIFTSTEFNAWVSDPIFRIGIMSFIEGRRGLEVHRNFERNSVSVFCLSDRLCVTK